MTRSPIDTEDLNIQLVQGFGDKVTMMEQAPMYDFDISTGVKQVRRKEPSQLEGIYLDLRTEKEKERGQVFGTETFEDGGLAIAAVAGAIIVTALVAGGAYLVFQAQKAMEFGEAVLEPGIQIAGGIAEAIAPSE